MKADRLLSIITLLTETDLISAPRLAEILEVSPRTIYRDIETLSMAGIPIFTTTGKYGGIGILDSYKVNKHLLNVNDVKALLLGLNSIDKIIPNQSLLNTKLKIKNIVDENHSNNINNQILIDPSSWGKGANIIQTFETIQKAIQSYKIIYFSYIDRMNNSTKRKVEPHCLIFKSSNWYLQAYCLEKNDYRLFMLQRISNIELSDETYSLRENDYDSFKDLHFNDSNIITVKLRIYAEIINKFILQYGTECILSKQKNHYIIQIPLPANEWGHQYILSLSDKCECLEPIYFREKIKYLIQNMLNQYN